jgi:dCTP deaminase
MTERKEKNTDEYPLFPEGNPNSAILNSDEILSMVRSGSLVTSSTFDQRCLQEASYDVRIGNKGIMGGEGTILDLTQHPLMLAPGSYAGVVSFEKLKLPNHVLAQIGAKRKIAYEGLILLTGSIVDPGYEGHLLFGLYNASTRKVVLPTQTKICNLTFTHLNKEMKPVPPDPNLLRGDLPSDFVNKMANMDVLPWSEISSEVRRIQQLAKDVLELRQRYEDVLEPIKQLTTNVASVTGDVRTLTQELRGLGEKVGRLDEATQANARQLAEVMTGVKMLTSEVSGLKETTSSQEQRIGDVRTRVEKFSVILYIVGSIVLLVLGALINRYVFAPKSGTSPVQSSGIVAPASPTPLMPTKQPGP